MELITTVKKFYGPRFVLRSYIVYVVDHTYKYFLEVQFTQT
jgi:hypothetical protein